MFEAFLLKYPNDKRWTPDAMFRLAELYYEKSAEEYLDADEAYKKAHRLARTRPTTPPPRVDYTPTINLYRRLADRVPELPLPRRHLLPARLLPGRDGRGRRRRKQALLALVCANKYKPLDSAGADAEAAAEPRHRRRPATTSPTRSCTPVRKDSKFLPEAWTRVGEFHFDSPNELQAGHRGLPQGADVQGLALLRPRALQARLVVLPRQPLPRGGARVRQPGQVRRRSERRPARRSAPTCAPRRSSTWASASPSPTGTATRCPIR